MNKKKKTAIIISVAGFIAIVVGLLITLTAMGIIKPGLGPTPSPTPFLETDAFDYKKENGYIILLKYKGTETAVKIPSHIDGMTVSAIGPGCFANADTKITSLYIPSTVTSLGDHMCRGLDTLTDIVFEDENTLKSIGVGVISGTPAEKSILNTHNGMILWGNVLVKAVSNNKAVFVIPDNVVSLAPYALDEVGAEGIRFPFGYDMVRSTDINVAEGVLYIIISSKSTRLEGTDIFNSDEQYIKCYRDSVAEKFALDYGLYYDLLDDGETWKYEESDGEVTVTKYLGGSKNVRVPSYINGKPVTQIGNGKCIFASVGNVKRLYIPDTVLRIAPMAVNGAENLEEVEFGDAHSLTGIGKYAFEGTKFCDESNMVGNMSVVGGILVKCVATGDVRLPEGIRGIADCAFGPGVTRITLPEGCEILGEGMLENAPDVEWIYIPNTVKGLTNSIFKDHPSIFIECDVMSDAYDFVKKNGYDHKAVYYWEYTVNADGKTAVLTVYTGKQHSVVVPAEIDGYKVTELMSIRNSTITEIIIPATVTKIHDMFAYKLDRLERVTFENVNKLTYIGAQAFKGTAYEAQNVDDNGVLIIGKFAAGFVGSGEVVVDESVEVITERLFYGSDVTKITLPIGCVSIGARAFSLCEKLEYVYIPDSVTSIGDFITDSSDKAVINCHGNSYAQEYAKKYGCIYVICEYDGWMYDVKDGKVTITAYLGDETDVVIPKLIHGYIVTAIGDACFYGRKLESVYIPSSVTHIYAGAFEDVATLKTVTFENVSAIEFVGNRAFYGTQYIESAVGEDGLIVLNGTLISCKATGHVVLPYYVRTVADNVFSSAEILSVTINEGCKEIRKDAFAGATSLEWVFIPESVVSAEAKAFDKSNKNTVLKGYGNSFVTELAEEYGFACENSTVEYEYSLIGENGAGGVMLEKYLGSSTEIIIPEFVNGYKVTAIGVGCFEGKKPVMVYIPGSVTIIKAAGFGAQLETVVFENESNISYVDRTAFVGTKFELRLNLDNNGFSVIGGILIRCTVKGDIVLPSGVKQVVSGVFEGRPINTITVNNGCKIIDAGAFAGIWSAKWILIPNSVESLGEKLISDKRIYFKCNAGSYAETYAVKNGYKYEIVDSEDYEWRYLIENGNVILTKYIGTEVHVIVPYHIGGMPVVAIDEACFKDDLNVKSVYIAAGVKSIGNEAFAGTRNMESILFGDKSLITTIGYGVFTDCGAVAKLADENGMFVINGILVAYSGGENAVFSNGIESVAGRVFYGNTVIKSVTVNSSCKAIGWQAFAGATGLEKIIIPDSVTKIDADCFDKDVTATFVVGKDSWAKTYVDKNGFATEELLIPFEYEIKDGKVVLTKYTGNQLHVAIPSMVGSMYVTELGEGCFIGCDIVSIWVPQTVTVIGRECFYNCGGLEEIVFADEKSITYIGANAFRGTLFENMTGVDENNMVSINGILIRHYGSGDIVVPSFIKGIAGGAFFDRQDITTVTLMNGCEWVGELAFDRMFNLEAVRLPDSISYIERNAFASCKEGFVIMCNPGTYAEEYAKENSIGIRPTVMP